MEFLHGSPRQTTNTDLAAALCTLGIPRNSEKPLEIFVGDVERIAFFFEEASTCGLYQMGDCVGMWDDPALDHSRPHHALTFMRSGLRSRSRLINYALNGVENVTLADQVTQNRPGQAASRVDTAHPKDTPWGSPSSIVAKKMDSTSTALIVNAIASSTAELVAVVDAVGVAMQISALIVAALLAAIFFGKVWK